MSRLYRVHEFARLAGFTVKALHHYDRLGLLKPQRTEAGYRMYQARDLECLEQIVALKFLGLSLQQIRRLLDRSSVELPEALRLQRCALERKQRLLGRAIDAIRQAEKLAQSGRTPGTAVLRRIIEVIHMQNNVDLLEQHYGEQSLARWKEFFRQANAAAGEDPAGEKGFAVVERWVGLTESVLANSEVHGAMIRAWYDRQNWPPDLHQKMAEFASAQNPYRMNDRLSEFLAEAFKCHRRKFYSDEAWKRFLGGPLS